MDAPAQPFPCHMAHQQYSNNGGACVEVADNQPGIVAVRDSKDRIGPVLVLTINQWRAFTSSLRTSQA